MSEAYLGERLIIRGNRIGCYVFLTRLLFPYKYSIAWTRMFHNLFCKFFLATDSWLTGVRFHFPDIHGFTTVAVNDAICGYWFY